MKRRWHHIAGLIAWAACLDSFGASLSWTGALSADFYNPTNWNPMAVPAPGDTLNIATGAVNISPPFTSTGKVNWSAGNVSGALTIANGGTLAIGAGGGKYLIGSITNAGTITLADTLYFGASNIQEVNLPGALFDIQADVQINGAGNSGLQITNAGTFRKSAGTNACAISGVLFQNSGALSALSGTLDLQSGGTLGGTWTAAGGATLTFSGGTFAVLPEAVSSGPGFIGVAGGSTTFTGTLGTTMGWTGGSVYGNWSIATSGKLAIGPSGSKYLISSITNAGTITLSDTLYFSASGLVEINEPGALFDIQADVQINGAGNSGLQITNAGTFRKSAGTNACAISGVLFQNTGALSALSGTLDLQSGGTLGGTWTAASGAALTFSGGTFALLPDAVSSGPGFIGVRGTPTFTGTLGTSMGWTSGSISGDWSIATNGVLAIGPSGSKYLISSITNAGTITLSDTLYFGASGLEEINEPGALFDVQADVQINGAGNSGLQITNAGTFRKSAGTNACAIAGVLFQNTGALSALSGTLDLQSGGTLGGAWMAAGGAALTFSGGTFAVLPEAVSSGPGFMGVARGSTTFTGTLGTTMGWTGGTVYGNWSIATSGKLVIGPIGAKYLGASITNAGTITLADTLYFGASGLEEINEPGALFDIQADVQINGAGNSGLQITNAGTFRKSAGTNACAISGVLFQNTGALSALSGTLDLQSGGTLGGAWMAAGGAALTFSGGTFAVLPEAVSSGPGFMGVARGSTTFTGTLGTTMGWTGGTVYGNWSIATSGKLVIGPSGAKYLGASVTNAGTITLADTLYFGASGLEEINEPGALFDVQADVQINNSGNSGLQITNAGTFRKSAGTNACAISGVLFQNTGALSALSGTLDLQSGGTLGGTWMAASGAALTFSGGTFAVLPEAVSSGPGFMGVARGSTTFTGTLGTTMGWTGGTVYGNWSIATSGKLVIGPSGAKYLGASITNAGTITLADTLYFGASGLEEINEPGALFDVQGDVQINNSGNSGLQIINEGTFRKSAGTGSCVVSGINCQNAGVISVLTGVLSFTSPFTSSDGELAVRLNSATNWGQFAFSGNLALNGSLQVNIANAFAPAIGSKFEIISSGALSGAFGSLNVPTGTTVFSTNNAVYVVVSNALPAQVLSSILTGGGLGFTLATANGQSYTIQSNADLTTTNWADYTNFTGNGSLLQVVVPISGVPENFFRIRQP